jgi:hypothetical protein
MPHVRQGMLLVLLLLVVLLLLQVLLLDEGFTPSHSASSSCVSFSLV